MIPQHHHVRHMCRQFRDFIDTPVRCQLYYKRADTHVSEIVTDAKSWK